MAVLIHGGRCCGIRHSVGWSLNNDRGRIYEKIKDDKAATPVGRLLEVVVTDGQLISQPNLGPALAAEEFRLVSRFMNDNSGNVCNVFHYIRSANIRPISQPIPDPVPWVPPPPPDSPPGYRRVRPSDFIKGQPVRLRVWWPGSWHHNRYYRYYGKGMDSKTCNMATCKFKWDHVRIEIRA